LARVPKGSIQAQKDDAQASGVTKAKKRRRFKKQLLSWRFAPNHQNPWSWHHPYSLPMLMWNSSLGMHGYSSTPYFDPWYGFYVMEGCQIILLINDPEPKYLFRLCMFLWMNSYGRYFDIALNVKYSR
jgi:hypothetical protein